MRYRRNPEVRATDVEGEYFLVEPASGQIFYLDRLASGLWHLLAEAQAEAEILGAYRAAFPDEPATRVEEEVGAALQQLVADRLVVGV